MIYTEFPQNLDEVDVIIAGGGTAACVVASRLVQADTATSVLVIEQGPDNRNIPSVIHPALYRENLVPTTGTALYYFATEEAQLNNRSIVVPAGGVLGGGSSVNACIYARPQRVDYDSWDTEGWSADDLVPFVKKLETYYPTGDQSVHGSEGPVGVSRSRYSSELVSNDFFAAVKNIGIPVVSDVQDLDQAHAAAPSYQYVSPKTGRRQDAAHTYLHPLIDEGADNLHVLVHATVTRVLFDDGKRASAVQLVNNDSTFTVKARKLVVVSSGGLGTPQILERSGVGSAEVLGNAGVSVVSDVLGVGHDYQDHQMIVAIYDSKIPAEDTLDSVVNGAMNMPELLEADAEILSWNGMNAFSKLRPTQPEIDSFEPGLRRAWDRDYANNPTKPLGIVAPMAGILGLSNLHPSGSYVSLAHFVPYPYSRGSVHITGPALDNPADFKTGYLSDPDEVDVQILCWLYKKQRQLARIMHTCQGQVGPVPQYTVDSKATDEIALNAGSSEPVTYTAADDEAIKQWARQNVGTTFHSMGTCKMAPREKSGVVDQNLSVYGTKGLKVADLSIVPENVSGNTMNTALLVGEKAADIFIKELGLSGLADI